jgi:plasmid maintenance system killer protein
MPLDDSTIAVFNELLAERDKLDQIESAASLEDLRAPPGNRLERLRGDRRGQHSVRINVRYRARRAEARVLTGIKRHAASPPSAR